jgi:hypothetical protein
MEKALGFTTIDSTLAIDAIQLDVDISVNWKGEWNAIRGNKPRDLPESFPVDRTKAASFGGQSLPV